MASPTLDAARAEDTKFGRLVLLEGEMWAYAHADELAQKKHLSQFAVFCVLAIGCVP